MDKLGIIMLNWNGHEDTIECIASIRSNEDKKYPIFILDNNSQEGSVKSIELWIKKEYGLSYQILSEEEFLSCEDFSGSTLYFIKGRDNLGFAKGNNLVWNKIKDSYQYTLLLNNDTIITKHAFTKMVDYMDKNEATGVLTCDIRYYSAPQSLWNAGGYFTWYGDRKYFEQSLIDGYKEQGVQAISAPFITGCVLMARQDIVNKHGVFTERFFFGEEDFNYCMRLQRAGVKVEAYLDSTIYHKVGTSIKKAQSNTNSMILHFSNRVIDLKEFYSPLRWRIWRVLYLGAVFAKIILLKNGVKTAGKVVKEVYKLSSRLEGISQEVFLQLRKAN